MIVPLDILEKCRHYQGKFARPLAHGVLDPVYVGVGCCFFSNNARARRSHWPWSAKLASLTSTLPLLNLGPIGVGPSRWVSVQSSFCKPLLVPILEPFWAPFGAQIGSKKHTKNKKNPLTIGLAFSFQKYKKIPTSKHDVKLDYVLTEKGIF